VQERADRVIFKGNRVSYHFMKPRQDDAECPEVLLARMAEFRRRLPRHSDQPYRLALAFEALRQAGEKAWSAANLIWEALQELPASSRKEQRQWAKLGIPIQFKVPKYSIGSTKRGHRTKRKRRGIPNYHRRAETIRAQACRFKSQHPDFRRRIDAEFAAFRWRFCRDAEWYTETESMYWQRLASLERAHGEHDQCTAEATAVLARHLHEQGKFEEAIPVYSLALERWKLATPVSEERRQTALAVIAQNIADAKPGDCLHVDWD
jgi:hypothetical protein